MKLCDTTIDTAEAARLCGCSRWTMWRRSKRMPWASCVIESGDIRPHIRFSVAKLIANGLIEEVANV